MASCDRDATYLVNIAGARHSAPQSLLATAISGNVVRRTHDVLANMSHIIDQGKNLKVLQQNGTSYTVPLGVEGADVVDVSSIKRRNDVFGVLYKGDAQSGLVLFAVGDDSATAKLTVKFPEGKYAVKAELRGAKGAEQALVLFGDGSLTSIALGKIEEGAPVEYGALKEGVATEIQSDLYPRDFSLSTDGKIAVAVSTDGTVMTFNAETAKPLCAWTPDEPSQITAVRAVTANVDATEVKGHTVAVVHGDATPPTVSLYHVKGGADGCWEAWKSQKVTLDGMTGVSVFEAGCGGDVLVAAEKNSVTLVTMRLTLGGEAGKTVRSISHFDCDRNLGEFVSIVARSEKEGVRVSARRAEALVLHDVPYTDITALPLPTPAFERSSYPNKTVDELRAMVKTLEAENAKLREENTLLQARPPPNSLPKEIEDQLRQTTAMVNETCRQMVSTSEQMHNDVNGRLAKLEESLADAQRVQAKSMETTKAALESTKRQAITLIQDSANRDQEQIANLHRGVNEGLVDARRHADEFYKSLAAEMHNSRVREADQLSEGLRQKVVSLLSEPGLARLKEMVTTNAFTPDVYQEGEAIIRETIQDSLTRELKDHMGKTAEVFLQNERDMLQRMTKDIIGKSETLLQTVVPAIAAELKAGFDKFGADGYSRALEQWQTDAERRLREVEEEGRKVIADINNDPLGDKLGQLDKRRKIRRAFETDEFWTKGVAEIFEGSGDVPDAVFAYIFESMAMPPHVPRDLGATVDTRQLHAFLKFTARLIKSLESPRQAESKLCYLEAVLSVFATVPALPEEFKKAMRNVRDHAQQRNCWRNHDVNTKYADKLAAILLHF